jgi:uncharacterized membrane protein
MRVRIFFGTLLLLVFNVLLLHAQSGDPQGCSGTDIDNPCPLDTWVIILAIIAVVFAAIYLNHKQKSLKPVTKGIK